MANRLGELAKRKLTDHQLTVIRMASVLDSLILTEKLTKSKGIQGVSKGTIILAIMLLDSIEASEAIRLLDSMLMAGLIRLVDGTRNRYLATDLGVSYVENAMKIVKGEIV